jgi:inorganic pyrophosphatase
VRNGSPKFTRRKFEISTTEAGNPIKQDQKNGVPRVFNKGEIFFNYGCFPRTWEVSQGSRFEFRI